MARADEAASLFLNGDPATARLILRDLVNATVDSLLGKAASLLDPGLISRSAVECHRVDEHEAR